MNGVNRLRYWLAWHIMPPDKNRVEGRFMVLSNSLELSGSVYTERGKEQVDNLERELGLTDCDNDDPVSDRGED